MFVVIFMIWLQCFVVSNVISITNTGAETKPVEICWAIMFVNGMIHVSLLFNQSSAVCICVCGRWHILSLLKEGVEALIYSSWSPISLNSEYTIHTHTNIYNPLAAAQTNSYHGNLCRWGHRILNEVKAFQYHGN